MFFTTSQSVWRKVSLTDPPPHSPTCPGESSAWRTWSAGLKGGTRWWVLTTFFFQILNKVLHLPLNQTAYFFFQGRRCGRVHPVFRHWMTTTDIQADFQTCRGSGSTDDLNNATFYSDCEKLRQYCPQHTNTVMYIH